MLTKISKHHNVALKQNAGVKYSSFQGTFSYFTNKKRIENKGYPNYITTIDTEELKSNEGMNSTPDNLSNTAKPLQ